MMYCPECRGEYREGFSICKDCNIPLTDTLPVKIYDENEIRHLKTKRVDKISIGCMAATIALMLYPYGVVNGPINYRSIFFTPYMSSYFYISYGNVFPIITALLSIVILVMLVVRLASHAKKENAIKPLLICRLLSVCIVASLLSWLLFGGFTITLVGIMVLLLHITTLVLQIRRA